MYGIKKKKGGMPQMKSTPMESSSIAIAKKGKPNPSLSANTESMGVGMPSAKMGENLSLTANLRAAKKGVSAAQKEPKLEAEVSLGPTESTEYVRKDYLERLKKRGK